MYGSFRTAKSFLKAVEKETRYKLNDLGLYEIVRKGRECRLYADLEWIVGDIMSVEFIQQTVLELIAGVLKMDVEKLKKVAKFTNASKDTKGSLHLVIPTLKFADTTAQQRFWNAIHHELLKHAHEELWFLDETSKSYILKTFVDFSVYNADRQIRILNAGKMGQDGVCYRPLLACDENGNVMSAVQSLSLPKKERLKYFITHLKGDEVLVNVSSFPEKIVATRRQQWSKALVTGILAEKCPEVTVADLRGRLVHLKNKRTMPGGWCPMCGDCTGNHNAHIILEGNKMVLKCFSAKQASKKKILYQMDDVVDPDVDGKTLLEVLESCWEDYQKAKTIVEPELQNINEQTLPVRQKQQRKKEVMDKLFAQWKQDAISKINHVSVIISGDSVPYVLYKDHPQMSQDSKIRKRRLIYNEKLLPALNQSPFSRYKVEGKSIIGIWLDDMKSKCYSYANCVYETPKNKLNQCVFNKFTQLAITHDEAIEEVHHSHPLEGELLNFQQFIKTAWCEDNLVIYDYVVKWFAHQVQFPGHKLGVSLVLMGSEGCGKGSVIQVIGKILGGQYFFQPTNTDSVWGQFNHLLQDRFLVYMDEMVWGGDKVNRGNLIKLITEGTITVNKKFAAQKVAMNRSNFIFASNEHWVIPATPMSRRFCVLSVTDHMIGISEAEKKRIWNIDPYVVAKWLYNVDLEGWNPRDYPQGSDHPETIGDASCA